MSQKRLSSAQVADGKLSESTRILCTPSGFAKSALFYVQEIGRLKSLRPHASRRERLDSYLFLLVAEGGGRLTCGGHRYSLGAASVALINCREPYEHESSGSDPWQLWWVHFNGRGMTPYYDFFRQKHEAPVFRAADPSFYTGLIDKLMDASSGGTPGDELQASLLLDTLVTHLLTEDGGGISTPTTLQKLEAVRSFLDANYAEDLSLDSLAERFYISKYHLCREFRRRFDSTVAQYVIHRRVNHAKELLRFTDLTIERVGVRCGMADASYFNRLFHRLEGVTAKEYRKKWRGG